MFTPSVTNTVVTLSMNGVSQTRTATFYYSSGQVEAVNIFDANNNALKSTAYQYSGNWQPTHVR